MGHRDAGVRRELLRGREIKGKITLPDHLRHDRRSPGGSHQTGHARGEGDGSACGTWVRRCRLPVHGGVIDGQREASAQAGR